MFNWKPAEEKNKFTVNQTVAYFIHSHDKTVLCQDSKKDCLRKGEVSIVTYWRRGEEFAYRVSDQYGNFYWMREKYVYLPAEAEQKKADGHLAFLRSWPVQTGPNVQNIPVRTELGREIRKAFVKSYEESQHA